MQTHYDYIITGAGAAGLSLLMRFISQPAFSEKKILVVDKSSKNTNDRTWCFWEKGEGIFEPVVHAKWNNIFFYSNTINKRIALGAYHYKMIRGIDLYQFVINKASDKSQITFCFGNVDAVGDDGSGGFAIVDGEKYTAEYVFNSILFKPLVATAKEFYLLQHFKGYVIETNAQVFDPACATLMDFRISQQHGTAFVYVLPISASKALVEYTLFSGQLLSSEQYIEGLKSYISQFIGSSSFSVIEEEFGIIPMTNIAFKKNEGRVIHLGTAGGQTKGSSGYTFRFIQKHSDRLIQSLLKQGHPYLKDPVGYKRFAFYDTTLLNILAGNKYPAAEIFSRLFERNAIESVFRFLDNETTLAEELRIMATLPKGIFAQAALEEIIK